MRTQNPTPDIVQMFQLAEQYSVASNLLVKQSRGDKPFCGAPYLLVDSFAVELYLKCLQTQETDEAPNFGHDLRRLFDAISEPIKRQIREAFQRVIDADVVLRHLPAINPEAVALGVLDFDRSLNAASDTFANRRYAYEPRPQTDWYYAHLLRLAIRDIAKVDLRVAKFVDPEAGEPPHSNSE